MVTLEIAIIGRYAVASRSFTLVILVYHWSRKLNDSNEIEMEIFHIIVFKFGWVVDSGLPINKFT